MTKLKTYAPAVLRIGMSFVILWFGSQQLLHVSAWVGFLPDWVSALPVTPEQLVYLNGLFEVICGAFMLAGFYTRFAALLLVLHMLEITHVVFGQGLIETAVRDFGLAIALVSVFFHGSDSLSVDTLWQR